MLRESLPKGESCPRHTARFLKVFLWVLVLKQRLYQNAHPHRSLSQTLTDTHTALHSVVKLQDSYMLEVNFVLFIQSYYALQ